MSEVEQAASLIKAGKLVVFPTETVYGLGANALMDSAVAEIYALKNRPTFNPLIAHVTGKEMASQIVEITPLAEKLMDVFWPAPLTLVLKRKGTVSLLATAGLDTLAVRMPNHPLALELIEKSGVPIVAPSANASGTISPTTAQHVRDSFKEKTPFILDGGPCSIGVESTILLMTEKVPVVLRYGGLAVEDIEKVIGPVARQENDPLLPRSPGQLKSHYAPSIPLRMNATEFKENEAILGFGNVSNATLNLSPEGNLKEAAAHLFAMMHELDKPGKYTGIAVMPIPLKGLGLAINDRLKRAAAPKA